MADLIEVPVEVARTAAAALARRQEMQGGGSARAVAIASVLTTGIITEHELEELRLWHGNNPEAVRAGGCTLPGGLYGGGPARAAWEPLTEIDPEPQTAAPRSPLRDRLARLSATLNSTDRKLRLRLHAAAEVALNEALRQAAVKVNVKARTKAQKAMVASATAYTPAMLAAVGTTEQELLDKRFDTLAAAAAAWILAAEHRKLRATATALGLDPDDLDREYDDEMTARAEKAAGFLAVGLGILARSSLSGTPLPDQGEHSGPVPFGLVRDTLVLGSSSTPAPRIDESGTGPASIDAIQERLTQTGETLAEELLAREGLDTITQHTWEVGDPLRPFEPHQDLAGTSWTGDETPPELAWDPGEFPFVDALSPGDHDGCQCEDVIELVPAEDVLV